MPSFYYSNPYIGAGVNNLAEAVLGANDPLMDARAGLLGDQRRQVQAQRRKLDAEALQEEIAAREREQLIANALEVLGGVPGMNPQMAPGAAALVRYGAGQGDNASQLSDVLSAALINSLAQGTDDQRAQALTMQGKTLGYRDAVSPEMAQGVHEADLAGQMAREVTRSGSRLAGVKYGADARKEASIYGADARKEASIYGADARERAAIYGADARAGATTESARIRAGATTESAKIRAGATTESAKIRAGATGAGGKVREVDGKDLEAITGAIDDMIQRVAADAGNDDEIMYLLEGKDDVIFRASELYQETGNMGVAVREAWREVVGDEPPDIEVDRRWGPNKVTIRPNKGTSGGDSLADAVAPADPSAATGVKEARPEAVKALLANPNGLAPDGRPLKDHFFEKYGYLPPGVK